jgi:hypothetical protein
MRLMVVESRYHWLSLLSFMLKMFDSVFNFISMSYLLVQDKLPKVVSFVRAVEVMVALERKVSLEIKAGRPKQSIDKVLVRNWRSTYFYSSSGAS